MNSYLDSDLTLFMFIFTLLFLILYLSKFAYQQMLQSISSKKITNRIQYIKEKHALKTESKNKIQEKIELAYKKYTWKKTKSFLWFSLSMVFLAAIILILHFSILVLLLLLLFYSIGVLTIYLLFAHFLAKRKKQFISDFPDALELMVRSVSAGHAVTEAIKIVAENSSGLLSEEFRLIKDSISMGSTLVDALETSAKHINISEFKFFVIIISVQQQTGGNIAKLLTELANTLRNKKIMEEKIKSLASEPLASAIVIGALPFVILFILSILSPSYVSPLINDHVGNFIILFCILAQILGILVLKKIIKIEL